MALLTNEEKKQRVRQRVRVRMEEGTYETYPETIRTDHYQSDKYQRVAIYARVSTDDVCQTTSFELQKKYYEDFVAQHPKWELVGIYADEGISGTSTKKRDAFNRMMADAKDGKIDLIRFTVLWLKICLCFPKKQTHAILKLSVESALHI